MFNSETKICQNCHESFVIDAQDFDFYKRIEVPAPTWCPECRLQNQLIFRNERTLYKRRCDVPGHYEEVISIYSPENKLVVYDQNYWWSDAWDGLQYGRNYDWDNSFLEQFSMLIKNVPWPTLVNRNGVNSDYCHSVYDMKNCYLVFAAAACEDSYYMDNADYAKNSMDHLTTVKNELTYELVFCNECYDVKFAAFCRQCSNSAFLIDCRGCSNCFGCVNLRNKQYHIFNEPYSKNEYVDEIKKYNLGSFKNLSDFLQKYNKFRLKIPYKYARISYSTNATGDNIKNAKNVKQCFDVVGDSLEDSKYITLSYMRPTKDSQSVYTIGDNSSLCYNAISLSNVNLILFSKKIWNGHHIQYSYNCHSSSNLFGCIGLRNKQYCILNKQYTKEEYEELVPRIIEHMNEMPYVDKKGRLYKYGEFFPPELSPFAYNETIAQEYFPLTKEQAIKQGYRWKEPEERNYQISIFNTQLPDHIKDVKDDIVNQIIECCHKGECNEQCTQAFKIIPEELQFYRKMNLPLPRLCPNCRHYQRLKQRNPLKLWHRKCQCAGLKSENGIYQNTVQHFHGPEKCPNEFETTYSPDRSEIVYCEACYNSEIV